VITMPIQILPPDEAAKKAKERVAEWKRQREIDAAKTRADGTSKRTGPKAQLPSSEKQIKVHKTRKTPWLHPSPEIPEHKQKLNDELANAVRNGNISKANDLLDAGADINSTDDCGNTPLMQAIWFRKKDMIKFLLEKGADVNFKNKKGVTALAKASQRHWLDDADTVKLLIEAGARVNDTYPWSPSDEYIAPFLSFYEWTALMIACYSAHAGAVEALLSAGADVRYIDEKGITPLMLAAFRRSPGSVKTIQLLIDAGADINARDNKGKTALTYAKFDTCSKNKEILRRYGATE